MRQVRPFPCGAGVVLFSFFSLVPSIVSAGDAAGFGVHKSDGRIRITIDGRLFTEYVTGRYAKPILYPVMGPGQIPMTRNYPMKEVKGEAHDHPHHKSIWYTHGDINGVNFWNNAKDCGRVVQEKLLKAEARGDSAVLKTVNKWMSPGGKTVCTDTRTLTFRKIPQGRVIDWEITMHASEGKVVFGDTKEGTMGIRTHPNLRLKNGRGVTTANGRACNSEGVTGKAVWGKRAKWVDYRGTIDGEMAGVAIFDHPSNPRHPTWWHARDYGLVAANAFGVHNFEGKPRGTGDYIIPEGQSRTFRFRFIFHRGDNDEAGIEKLYERYAAQK